MFYTENAATLLIVPLCLYTIAFAALPLPLRSRLGSSGFQTVALNYNSTAQINLTLSVGLHQLPPDPAIIEVPDVPSTIIRLHSYGAPLGPFATNSIVLTNAIDDAAQHAPTSHIKWSTQTYSVDKVPVQLWVKRDWGPGWYGESMTWGEWRAAVRVLWGFARDWEFVALGFEVVHTGDDVDIAFGQLRRT